MYSFRSMLAASVAALLCTGAASAQTRIDAQERAKPGAVRPASSGTNNGATCKVSFATATGTFTPPDDLTNLTTTPLQYQASAVAALKPCAGSVIAFFNTEVNTSQVNAYLHATARATCVATGNQVNPCTVGQVVIGDPGHTYLQNSQQGTETHGAIFVFPQLAKGQWRFEVDVGGDGTAYVGFRTLVVEMFGK